MTDHFLDRYNPLRRVLHIDRFSGGMHGWTSYFPDYDGATDYTGRNESVESLDMIFKRDREQTLRWDLKPPTGARSLPMLSSLSSWDVGTTGAATGTYALKVPTPALAGVKVAAQKRMTCPWTGRFRVETWFTAKVLGEELQLGERDIRSIFLTFDAMALDNAPVPDDGTPRWWPSVRYLNYYNGNPKHRWQINLTGGDGVKNGPWKNLPNGDQALGYNRAATKYQWHYLRFTFNTTTQEYCDFHCYGKEFDVAGLRHQPDPPLTGFRASTEKCAGLLNCGFGIEADTDTRCALYLDAVVVSCEGTDKQ